MKLIKRVDKLLFFISESIYFLIYLCYKSFEWLKENRHLIMISLLICAVFLAGMVGYMIRINQVIGG